MNARPVQDQEPMIRGRARVIASLLGRRPDEVEAELQKRTAKGCEPNAVLDYLVLES